MLRHFRFFSAHCPSRAALSESNIRSFCIPSEQVAKKEEPKVLSRWRKLKLARQKAPTPANRVAYEFDRKTPSALSDALKHVRSAAWAKFDESLELVFRLNIDPRHADQNIRGVVSLPHGTGRPVRVAVFADPDAASAALAAGADLAGAEELVDSIAADGGASVRGFAACVAQPHLMPFAAAKLGKLLGPRGLLPSVKSGTVAMDVVGILRKVKKGQVQYRTDRAGNMHLIVGKLSFGDEKLLENILTATRAIMEARPRSVKKRYLKKAVICSAMGPSVMLDLEALVKQSIERQE